MYLKNNFEAIKNAIVESWSNKEGLIMLTQPSYDEYKQEISLQIQYLGTEVDLAYKDQHHTKDTDEASLDSFLEDLNTDICMVDVIHNFPGLKIAGWFWPDNEIRLADGTTVSNFNKYFSPQTGIFNFKEFFAEKLRVAEKSRPMLALSSFGSQERGTRSLTETDSPYPNTYESKLTIKPEMILKQRNSLSS